MTHTFGRKVSSCISSGIVPSDEEGIASTFSIMLGSSAYIKYMPSQTQQEILIIFSAAIIHFLLHGLLCVYLGICGVVLTLQ